MVKFFKFLKKIIKSYAKKQKQLLKRCFDQTVLVIMDVFTG